MKRARGGVRFPLACFLRGLDMDASDDLMFEIVARRVRISVRYEKSISNEQAEQGGGNDVRDRCKQ